MKPQICLGTAQFGLSYGITNDKGQIAENKVSQLLAEANATDISFIDTAQAYGDSEIVLGRNLPKRHSFKLISKLQAQRQQTFEYRDQKRWEQLYQLSCKRMNVKSLCGILLHNAGDLRKPGSEYLEDWLISLRERDLVERIGVSIYTAEDLEGINPKLLDLVQLPLSLYDQRLIMDGTVKRLRESGVRIHARSLYLQGLLLTSANEWPSWVGAEARGHQQRLQTLARRKGCQLIDLALGFAQQQQDLEAVVVGLCSIKEMRELQQAWKTPSPWEEDEWCAWGLPDTSIVDPRQWPR